MKTKGFETRRYELTRWQWVHRIWKNIIRSESDDFITRGMTTVRQGSRVPPPSGRLLLEPVKSLYFHTWLKNFLPLLSLNFSLAHNLLFSHHENSSGSWNCCEAIRTRLFAIHLRGIWSDHSFHRRAQTLKEGFILINLNLNFGRRTLSFSSDAYMYHREK